MLQVLAGTLVDQAFVGALRRSITRQLPRRTTALIPIVVTAFFAQFIYGKPANAESSKRPNIVLIMADDMGYSDIGCYGGEINTPTLDSLAAGGLRFTQFYNTGRCCPTRASLLSGLYPHQAGVGWMMTDRGHDGYRGELNRNCRTIAEVLRPAGYSTYMAGKWHVTPQVRPDGAKDNWPLQRSFDRFYGTIHGAGSFFDPNSLTRANIQISPTADPEYKPEQYYYTDAISDHAVRFIHEHEASAPDKPFFLYMEVYAAMVDCMDQGIGRIVESLRGANDLDNTLIFFLQDNGGCAETLGRTPRAGLLTRPDKPTLPVMLADELQTAMIPPQTRDGYPTVMGPGAMPGPDGTYIAYGRGWANVSNTPFREYKHWVHEGGISTPLIAHWPARLKRAGELEHQPGHLIDIMATCVDVAGAVYPDQVDEHPIKPLEGASLAPTFATKELNRKNPIYWEHEGNRAVRDGKWKLVAKENQPWELYDMEADRTELRDLATAMPDLAKSLSAKWDAWAERANVLPLGAWRGTPEKARFNKKQKRFTLKQGDDLPRDSAPFVENRAVQITATVKDVTDGVIVAQGGVTDGYALYIKNGKLTFATRQQGKLTTVTALEAFESKSHEFAITLTKSGGITLRIDGEKFATGEAPGAMVRMPLDGLQVGRDLNGAVGEYQAPFEFKGRILSLTLDVANN
jgi:arylsulfatase A-like enzyme